MKKKLVITFVILLILISGFFLAYKSGLTSKYNFISARRDISNGNIQLVSYGLPMIDENEIASKYGFKVVEVGCTVSKTQINGIIQYNRVVKHYLSNKFGDTWEAKYSKECDSLINVILNVKQ